MLITKITYKKKYVVGGAAIFGSIWNFLRDFFEYCGRAISVGRSSGGKKLQQNISE